MYVQCLVLSSVGYTTDEFEGKGRWYNNHPQEFNNHALTSILSRPRGISDRTVMAGLQ